MKLDPKIVDAALAYNANGYEICPEDRARRVLKAASKCVPDEVVKRAVSEFHRTHPSVDAQIRAVIMAGLAKWAEEE